mmetsp:Transcript_42042/g.68045  ORF Transcript_42042/g.68045 Transcript_42042/m.68045 type:complete len:144 (-) Transcript_42042:42-473(-)
MTCLVKHRSWNCRQQVVACSKGGGQKNSTMWTEMMEKNSRRDGEGGRAQSAYLCCTGLHTGQSLGAYHALEGPLGSVPATFTSFLLGRASYQGCAAHRKGLCCEENRPMSGPQSVWLRARQHEYPFTACLMITSPVKKTNGQW